MRMGLQVSADRGRYATKVEKLQADARWADEAGLDSVWTPQIPDEFDVMTAATLIGTATSRIEVGTAIVPLQPRHPIVLAQQALSNQAVCEGRFTSGLGVSHHWIIQDMLGLPYERGATTMRCYLDVLDQALRGPGMVDVDNELFTIHNPLDITDIAPTPVMIAALGPVMLKLAGERAAGTTLWLADERTIGSHVVPSITKAAEGRAGRRHGSWPASPSASAGTTRSRPPWRAQPHPQRGGGVPELRQADGARGRHQHRRRPGLRQRGHHGEAAAQLRRCRPHRLQRAHRPARGGPGRAQGVGRADPGIPRRGRALAPGLSSPSPQARGRVTMPPDRKSHSWVAAWSPSRASSLPLMVWA